jgi:hypothetical protein
MGGRYLVTGVQLGTLLALSKINADKCNKLINELIEKQFVGESNRSIKDDIRTVSKIYK